MCMCQTAMGRTTGKLGQATEPGTSSGAHQVAREDQTHRCLLHWFSLLFAAVAFAEQRWPYLPLRDLLAGVWDVVDYSLLWPRH